MTTQEKIDVLEYTHNHLFGAAGWGICDTIRLRLGGDHDELDRFLKACKIRLPKSHIRAGYCWDLNEEGDEQRRAFLREHIERLKKEL